MELGHRRARSGTGTAGVVIKFGGGGAAAASGGGGGWVRGEMHLIGWREVWRVLLSRHFLRSGRQGLGHAMGSSVDAAGGVVGVVGGGDCPRRKEVM